MSNNLNLSVKIAQKFGVELILRTLRDIMTPGVQTTKKSKEKE